MPYCPQCLAEYTEGATECADCHVRLEPGAPPPDANAPEPEPKLVRIRTFSGPTAVMQADLAKNLLQDQGILSFVPGETSAEILPGVDLVQLWVREQDADLAAEVLKSYLDATEQTEAENEAGEDSPPN
jgi:mono/diheme cytochrome c family protein